jgi:hypothetical protein
MPNGSSTNYTNDVQKTVVLSGVVQNENGTPISGVTKLFFKKEKFHHKK